MSESESTQLLRDVQELRQAYRVQRWLLAYVRLARPKRRRSPCVSARDAGEAAERRLAESPVEDTDCITPVRFGRANRDGNQ